MKKIKRIIRLINLVTSLTAFGMEVYLAMPEPGDFRLRKPDPMTLDELIELM